MKTVTLTTLSLLLATGTAFAQESHDHAIHQADAIISTADASQIASFDILAAHVRRDGNRVTFRMTTNGIAGADLPEAVGRLGGAAAYTYVWPTSLDPSTIGFDEGAGILAMVAAVHPDFDDTPLYDENADGILDNDGSYWHSHWVVLAPTEACGPGALAVKDIPEGTMPNLPVTWPGLPILIDNPGFAPLFDGPEVVINAVVAGGGAGASYDGVTAMLRIDQNVHAPLFCVTDVFDVASGDLSLPGTIGSGGSDND